MKAVFDEVEDELTEQHDPNRNSRFGKGKMLAEHYILSKGIPEGKRVYVMRPCMIHGPGNKGNLNLLFKLASKNIPWHLGRSITNALFGALIIYYLSLKC